MAIAIAVATPESSRAQQWARDMFAETTHDFGTVASGSKTRYTFEFTNKYRETVHVSGVRSSCGCTTPEVTKATLGPGETGGIVATFNTTAFTGAKSATVTVVFDKPFYAEVQLLVTGVILTDVQFTPSEIAFGEIAEGTEADQTVKVKFTGHPNLRIEDVRSLCEHLRVRLSEPRVQQGIVEYTMNVGIKPSAPEGDLNERLTLVTTDRGLKTVVVGVTGRVRPPVEVRPDAVHLGPIPPGKTANERLLVRGDVPFEIKKVDCEDSRFEFEATEGSKKVHFVKMTFTNDDSKDGKFRVPVKVVTSLPGDAAAECIVTGEAP